MAYECTVVYLEIDIPYTHPNKTILRYINYKIPTYIANSCSNWNVTTLRQWAPPARLSVCLSVRVLCATSPMDSTPKAHATHLLSHPILRKLYKCAQQHAIRCIEFHIHTRESVFPAHRCTAVCGGIITGGRVFGAPCAAPTPCDGFVCASGRVSATHMPETRE